MHQNIHESQNFTHLIFSINLGCFEKRLRTTGLGCVNTAYGINYTLFYELHIGKVCLAFRLVYEGLALEFHFVWVTILTVLF